MTDTLGIKVSMPMMPIMCSYIDLVIAKNKKAIIAHTNVRAINLAYGLPWFTQFLKSAGLNTVIVLVSSLACGF